MMLFYMSRAMGQVAPAQEDLSESSNKIHGVPGFDVGILTFVSWKPQTLRLERAFLGRDMSQVSL